MPKSLVQISSLILLLGALAVSVQAQSPQYTVVDLGPYFYVSAINDSGQVVGSIVNGQGNAVLYTDGVVKIITPPGSASANGWGINNLGDVVGEVLLCDMINNQCQNSRTRAFIYSKGVSTILGTLGGRDSRARAINDSGQVTGYSTTSLLSSDAHAFIFKDGTFTDIGAGSGVLSSYPYSINASGQVVGFASSSPPSNHGAFLYTVARFFFSSRPGAPLTSTTTVTSWAALAEPMTAPVVRSFLVEAFCTTWGLLTDRSMRVQVLLTTSVKWPVRQA
jgi:probable HAF family extracellular repeat protein